MNRPKRILVVCLGNHCRSPAAAAILSELGGESVEVRSAGLRDKWVGKPAHAAMIAAAARRGYDLTGHRGAPVDAALLRWADLILAMDNDILSVLRHLVSDRTNQGLALYLGDRDVPDPWGQPDPVFAACLDLLETGAHRLLTTLDHRGSCGAVDLISSSAPVHPALEGRPEPP